MAMRNALMGIVLLLAACGAPHAGRGVEANLRRTNTEAYRLTLRNHDSDDACFPTTFFPSDGRAIGFTVFDANGREKPATNFGFPVMERLPAHRLAARSRERSVVEFSQGVEAGDCVLLELIYRSCAEQDQFSAAEGVENPRFVRAAWAIEDRGTRVQPDLAQSCVPERALTDERFGG
jgi:hypothetical protein